MNFSRHDEEVVIFGCPISYMHCTYYMIPAEQTSCATSVLNLEAHFADHIQANKGSTMKQV